MANFYTIKQVSLRSGSAKSSRGKTLFQKQGTLDGACGAYSVTMALEILGQVNAEQIAEGEKGDSVEQNKFLKAINDRGLYPNGLSTNEVVKIVNEIFIKKAEAQPYYFKKFKEEDKFIQRMVDTLDNDCPVMLSFYYQKGKDNEGGHWVVAVGYEYDEQDEVNKLLLLDPSGEEPSMAPWNAYIKLNEKKAGKYVHRYVRTNDNCAIRLGDAIGFFSHKE